MSVNLNMLEGGKPLTAFLTCALYGSNPGYESVRRVTLGYRVKPPKKLCDLIPLSPTSRFLSSSGVV